VDERIVVFSATTQTVVEYSSSDVIICGLRLFPARTKDVAMRLLLIFASIIVVSAPFHSQEAKSPFGLPELHTIKTAVLSPPYSCRSREAFRSGYGTTALFLSKDSAVP